MLTKIWDRVANEPALVSAVVLAVANLIGADGSNIAALVETLIVVVAGLAVRAQVTPVRSL